MLNAVASNHDGNSSKDKILSAAEQEFAQKGYAGARIHGIAKASGLSVRMIYHYFGGKSALYSAVASANLTQIFATVGAAQRASRALPPIERLRAFVKANFEAAENHPGYLKYTRWELASGWTTMNDILVHGAQEITTILREDFEEAIAADEVDADIGFEFFLTTVAMYGMCYTGVLPRARRSVVHADGAEMSTEAHADQIADFLMRAITARCQCR